MALIKRNIDKARGQKYKSARLYLNMTVDEAAEWSGIPAATIRGIEAGREMPAAATTLRDFYVTAEPVEDEGVADDGATYRPLHPPAELFAEETYVDPKNVPIVLFGGVEAEQRRAYTNAQNEHYQRLAAAVDTHPDQWGEWELTHANEIEKYRRQIVAHNRRHWDAVPDGSLAYRPPTAPAPAESPTQRYNRLMGP